MGFGLGFGLEGVHGLVEGRDQPDGGGVGAGGRQWQRCRGVVVVEVALVERELSDVPRLARRAWSGSVVRVRVRVRIRVSGQGQG